jgi:hypothetical protein
LNECSTALRCTASTSASVKPAAGAASCSSRGSVVALAVGLCQPLGGGILDRLAGGAAAGVEVDQRLDGAVVGLQVLHEARDHAVDHHEPPQGVGVVRLRQPVLGAQLGERLGAQRALQVAMKVDQRHSHPLEAAMIRS